MPKPKPKKPLRWEASASFTLAVSRGPRQLIVIVNGVAGEWPVLALEGVALRKGAGLDFAAVAEQVLDNHAHALVGKASSPALALRMAEEYAVAWRDIDSAIAERCACGDIDG